MARLQLAISDYVSHFWIMFCKLLRKPPKQDKNFVTHTGLEAPNTDASKEPLTMGDAYIYSSAFILKSTKQTKKLKKKKKSDLISIDPWFLYFHYSLRYLLLFQNESLFFCLFIKGITSNLALIQTKNWLLLGNVYVILNQRGDILEFFLNEH